MALTRPPPEKIDNTIYVRGVDGHIRPLITNRAAAWGTSVAAEIKQGAQLNGLCLHPQNQRLEDFKDALKGKNLSKGILNRASLCGFNLDGTILDDCELNGANLEGVTGDGTSFRNVKAKNIRLALSRLFRPNLAKADLSYSNWLGAKLTTPVFQIAPGTIASRCGLTGSRMVGANITTENDLYFEWNNSILANILIRGTSPAACSIRGDSSNAIMHGSFLQNVRVEDGAVDVSPLDPENDFLSPEEKKYLRDVKQWFFRDEFPEHPAPINESDRKYLLRHTEILSCLYVPARNIRVACNGRFAHVDQKSEKLQINIVLPENVLTPTEISPPVSLPVASEAADMRTITGDALDTKFIEEELAALVDSPTHLATLFGESVQTAYAKLTKKITDNVLKQATGLQGNIRAIEAIHTALDTNKKMIHGKTPRKRNLDGFIAFLTKTVGGGSETVTEEQNPETLIQNIEALHSGIDDDISDATAQADFLYNAKPALKLCMNALTLCIDGLEKTLPDIAEKDPVKADFLRQRASSLRLTFISAGMGLKSLDLFYQERVKSQVVQLGVKGVTLPFLNLLLSVLASNQAKDSRMQMEALNDAAQRMLLSATKDSLAPGGNQPSLQPGFNDAASQLALIDDKIMTARNQWLDSLAPQPQASHGGPRNPSDKFHWPIFV